MLCFCTIKTAMADRIRRKAYGTRINSWDLAQELYDWLHYYEDPENPDEEYVNLRSDAIDVLNILHAAGVLVFVRQSFTHGPIFAKAYKQG